MGPCSPRERHRKVFPQRLQATWQREVSSIGSRGASALLFPDLSKVAAAGLLQLRLTLCDSVDCSPPGSSVHGIVQARILEWVAISFSRGSSHPVRSWYISTKLKNANSKRYMYFSVHSSIVDTCQGIKTVLSVHQQITDEWVKKMCYISKHTHRDTQQNTPQP